MTTLDARPALAGDAHRIKRVIGRFIGSGYVCYFLVSLPRMSLQASIVEAWWTPVAVVLAFVPGWLLLVTSFLPAREWTGRTLPLACGLGYLFSIGLWFVAWNGQSITTDATWLVTFPGLASLAMVLGPRPLLAGPHLIVVTILALATNWATDPQPIDGWLVSAATAWSIAFSSVFVAAGLMAVRTGEVLDASRDRAHRTAAEAAAEEARDVERFRYDGLVHDGVLAVMLAVTVEPIPVRLALQAQRVMDELDTAPDDPTRLVTVAELVAVLRTTVKAVGDAIVVSAQPANASGPQLTHAAVQALAGAAAEATRNSVRHAGVASAIGVTVAVDPAGVGVVVSDSGPGFDPLEVRSDRLGITVSIRDRMAAAGGLATVTSAPGSGTCVSLRWPA